MNIASCSELDANELYGMSRGLVLGPNSAKSADWRTRLESELINQDRFEI